jgi:hypothetical protein
MQKSDIIAPDMASRVDENLDQKFDHLFRVVGGKNFIESRAIGNEQPFYISAYHPSLQGRIDVLLPSLIKRLSSSGVAVLHLNFYDLVLELLTERGVLDRLIEKEPVLDRDTFLSTLRNVSDPKDHLVPLIAKKLEENRPSVVMLDGVGLVFPYIRSHNVLEKLQGVTGKTPSVLFFPGDYSFVERRGSYLKLFGAMPDDRYYRAFNIADIQP